MTQRYSTDIGNRYDGDIGIGQKKFDILLKGINNNTPNDIVVNEEELKVIFKIMIWDIYEEMSAKSQKIVKPIIDEYILTGDIAQGLLEVIALFNVLHYIEKGFEVTFSDDTLVSDFMLSPSAPPFVVFEDIFRQVKEYLNTGKLNPPQLATMGKLQILQNNNRQHVIDLIREHI